MMMDDYGRFQPRTHQRINQLQTRLRTLDLPPTSEAHIHDALGVMLDAHCEQKGRQSGEDYAQHPLEVALHVIEQFGATSPEVIIAALLHDTVEDQARKLVAMRDTLPSTDGELQEQALRALADRFGPRVAELVSILTNPDFDALLAQYRRAGQETDKYQLYSQHFAQIYERDAEAFMIKMADFAQNALHLDTVPEGSRKAHFRRKYGPVILLTLDRLQTLTDPAHPLFAQRAALTAQLTAVYQRDYAPFINV
ncbi:MAG: bifunctional (p)ppGpp synthetase/guanosine-3',5'-bis(diphosphate) 3'-pyrophosphohydrolase [Ardenticatenaceae bacterium]|nr:bifunctional (p)ppGpp synthetase/guanosine-3',5'-bis(diphosphate) 3'-pyrophosphohydrolase [Ardenticatenaceae bacterium]MCB8989373.1 bifunctional (p)ppGpp synthetase/guanosine-3',5'-bis(diphosphate) 3'-pyrophosphohydrolase [Ardenticatenaceae bacterium]MCB9004528.1 bifunctional (p)ppGpp synthetase/guanosine-3',5'-bis(diphosphate) 3'-pyrophosphohydrolase [Ardenticatenaceae bacterium]